MIMSNSKNSSTGYDGYPSSQEICRICHCEAEPSLPLISPCSCCGSLQYVHQSCLQQWIKSSDTRQCELCKFPFVMRTKTKPLRKWRALNMKDRDVCKLFLSVVLTLCGLFSTTWSLYLFIDDFSEFSILLKWENLELGTLERRRLAFSVLLHVVGIGCVVWSLYVLVERAAQEVTEGELKWPFWTKLFVVGVGFGGGLVVMYIQCKTYLQLCHRWKAFNRVIYVQNAPEKVPMWYSDFQVISPSTSGKYRRASVDNNSEINIPMEGETVSLRENIVTHQSLTDIVIAGRLPDRYTNVGRYISPSKSVSDVTAVHYGNKNLKKAKSVGSGLPKPITLSVFKTSKESPSTSDDEDAASAVGANKESSPLLPALGTRISFSPSSMPPNLVIVHESEDSQIKGDIN